MFVDSDKGEALNTTRTADRPSTMPAQQGAEGKARRAMLLAPTVCGQVTFDTRLGLPQH